MADDKCTTSEAINQLADQLLSQRVVFFVGAGFSLSTEQIFNEKIMASLLCRFLAMTDESRFGKQLLFKQLRGALNQLFTLKIVDEQLMENRAWFQWKYIGEFCKKYYQFNEWMVHSFNKLFLFHCLVLKNHPRLNSATVSIEDNELDVRDGFIQTIAYTALLLPGLEQVLVDWFDKNDIVSEDYEFFLYQFNTKRKKLLINLQDTPWKELVATMKAALYECFEQLVEQVCKGELQVAALRQHFCSVVKARLDKAIVGKSVKDLLLDHQPLSLELLKYIDEEKRGKMIFIETVGLGNPKVMRNYQVDKEQLLPRYQVFGKLAREGLLPTLITTNYDLLLESGYRQVGLDFDEGVKESERLLTHLPLTAQLIKQPEDFFRYAAVLNPTHILKIHGCANQYREYRNKLLELSEKINQSSKTGEQRKKMEDQQDFIADKKRFNHYLDSIIYTYREIQHWRDDAWSRDYLQTLLRTRSFVFCGYSGADPVMHHTIRSIYEEIGRKIPKEPESGGKPNRLAYSTLGQKSLEFDTLEILNASSRAVGNVPHPHHHENYLTVSYTEGYPCLDMVFRLLLHRTSRKLQRQLLGSQLNQLALTLFSQYKPPSEVNRVIERFNTVLADEEIFAFYDDKSHPCQLAAQLVWSEHFHQQLLWLYMQGNDWQQAKLSDLQRTKPGAYFPLRENPLWSCWGIVLELAIRSAYAQLSGPATNTSVVDKRVSYQLPLPEDEACLYISIDGKGPLGLSLSGPGELNYAPKRLECCLNTQVWSLDPSAGLWPAQGPTLPSADYIWQLACGQTVDIETLKGYFAYVN
jgi:hypothetical protein